MLLLLNTQHFLIASTLTYSPSPSLSLSLSLPTGHDSQDYHRLCKRGYHKHKDANARRLQRRLQHVVEQRAPRGTRVIALGREAAVPQAQEEGKALRRHDDEGEHDEGAAKARTCVLPIRQLAGIEDGVGNGQEGELAQYISRKYR